MAVPGLVVRGVRETTPSPRVTEAASGPAAGREGPASVRTSCRNIFLPVISHYRSGPGLPATSILGIKLSREGG